MKKIFLLIGIMVGGAVFPTLLAQKVRYQGEVDLGFGLGLGTLFHDINRFQLETIHGVRVGSCFSAGIGAGIQYYLTTRIKMPDGRSMYELGDMEVVPLYFNMKGYLPLRGDVSPFLSLDVGYGFLVSQTIKGNPYTDYFLEKKDKGGLLIGPMIGFLFGRRAFISLGYECQYFEVRGASERFDAMRFRMGVIF